MWEYKIDNFSDSDADLITFLNQYSQEGWEFAAFTQAEQVGTQNESVQAKLERIGQADSH